MQNTCSKIILVRLMLVAEHTCSARDFCTVDPFVHMFTLKHLSFKPTQPLGASETQDPVNGLSTLP